MHVFKSRRQAIISFVFSVCAVSHPSYWRKLRNARILHGNGSESILSARVRVFNQRSEVRLLQSK